MDRRFQDINIVDKHFIYEKLVIPRGSKITAILFLSDKIYIQYIHNNFFQVGIIEFDELENYKKIVID